jgi:poly-gamma-glutamate capsule biosynthesis protein CapA/YwtB (metallophosphatase superfamily)
MARAGDGRQSPCPENLKSPMAHITIAAAGDLLGPYTPTLDLQDPDVRALSALFKGADVGFANQEGSTFDLKTFEGWLGAENGGGYPLHTLSVTRSLQDLGINLLGRANNHATDWGLEGMFASDRALDAIGIAHAGTGRSLDSARAAAYLDSPVGRVALVSAASTFPGMSPAGDPGRGAGPRPGMNPLHVDQVTRVTAADMRVLNTIAARSRWEGLPQPDIEAGDKLHIGTSIYQAATTPGITYDVSATDRAAIVHSVATASRQSSWVVFSIHAHETLSGDPADPAPADFLQPLFHDLIDAGADLVVRSGPHVLMGVEIYKNRPIFYGLGSLFFDIPHTLTLASEGPQVNRPTITIPEEWYDSAVALSEFQCGRLRKIRIFPLLIDATQTAHRGIPRRATGVAAQRILEKIRSGSAPFGTVVKVAADIGVIELPAIEAKQNN